MSGILLDTCAVIWTGNNEDLSPQATDILDRNADEGIRDFVSPVTAWEIGMLVSRSRMRLPMKVTDWFSTYLTNSLFALTEMSPEILVASSFLPETPPRDPFDRIIIATAREYGLRIMTRDRLILNYAEQGHVQAIAC
jgi:PIN domain nuclease of toxin-antitoxin system